MSGGGKRQLYYHVRGLVERGHHVEAWTPPAADLDYLPLSGLISEHIIPCSLQPTNQKSWFNELMQPLQGIQQQIQAMDLHCKRCAEEIHAGNFDLLFSDPCVDFRASFIGRHAKIPKVIYLHEPLRELYEASPQLPWVALPPPLGGHYSLTYLQEFLQDAVKVQALRIQVR